MDEKMIILEEGSFKPRQLIVFYGLRICWHGLRILWWLTA